MSTAGNDIQDEAGNSSFRRNIWYCWTLTVSLPTHGLLAPTPHGASYARLSYWTQNLIGSLFAVEAGESGTEPFPRVMQDLIYGSSASSEVWLGNDKSWGREQEEERGRQQDGGQGFDCSPEYEHYILYEIYSLQLSTGEFSLLGSLFVGRIVPDSSWHVHVCKEQIEFHLDWNFRRISQAELVWKLKVSSAELNLKELEIFCWKLALNILKGMKEAV